MAYKHDEGLKPYATELDWAYLKRAEELGSMQQAAATLGKGSSTLDAAYKRVRDRAARQGYSPGHQLAHPVPDGFQIKGVSTLYDKVSGEAKIQWVKSTADKERQAEMFREALNELAKELPRVPAIAVINPAHENHLMTCYPVGDHHLGMLSWPAETNQPWDIKIGETILRKASDYLIQRAPASQQATIVFLGDFMHYDSFEPVTPKGRNVLDADSRYPKMVRAAIRSMRHMIESAARKHEHVHVIIEVGNHDLSSSIFLMECLSNIYEDILHITVDVSPKHYHYFDFGQTLIGVHHGHGAKAKDLPLIMATDMPREWGKTKYHYWWTGHIHHDSVKDFHGCRVESFRVLPPEDAWAMQKGYRAARGMQSIILHCDFGEVSRHTVNPEMFNG